MKNRKKQQDRNPLDMNDLTNSYLKSLNKAIDKDREARAKQLEKMKQPKKPSKLLKFFKWFKLKK